MSDRLLAAIEAVQRELAKGTPWPWYVHEYSDSENHGIFISTADLDAEDPDADVCPMYALAHTDADNIAALMNSAPGMLEAARKCIENSQLVLSYQTRDDVYTAARAMLTPLFAEYAHLPEVQALEVER
jgi:hypothetical protein